MQLSPLILLALASITLALPTNDNATHASLIEKRSSRPWLTSFDDDDSTCKPVSGEVDDDRPFITAGTCVAYEPEYDQLGGSWGAGEYSISSWSAFENDDCTGAVKTMTTRKKNEHGFCFALSSLGCDPNGEEDLGNPCFWRSVQGNK
ncbi:hypothetical protein IMSHALPRED_002350 [Imshaugia aleurites]|uniref:Uncharacterized protein n=1 Tax=Imshaugia aleurites TaxID=172621 RepID=A0A8H3IGQ9_9LECA|nr:hypothetical protein IMSHALPRED_002350 [Imshaugia aleurites]